MIRALTVCSVSLYLIGFLVPVYSATEVSIKAPRPIVEMSGKDVVTIPFVVSNEGSDRHTFEETLELPPGWRLLSDPIPFQLGSGRSDTRLVHLYAPANQPAGQITIRYNVLSRTDRSVLQSTEVRVSVKQVGKAGLTVELIPNTVLAGGTFQARLKLKNTGNTTDNFVVSAEDGGKKFITSVTPSHVRLKAGSEASIVVNGLIPANLKYSISYPLRIKVSGRNSGIKINENFNISLVSRTPKGVGKYHSVSSRVVLRSVGAKAQGGASDSVSNVSQLEFSGLGILDNAADHRLGFDIRLQKDHLSTASTPFGLDEKYKLNYSNKHLRVDLGDYNDYFSALLSGNSGRGLAIKYDQKDWWIKASLLQAVNSSSEGDTSAISVGYRFNDRTYLRGIYSQEDEGNYLGLQAKYNNQRFRSSFEFATSDGENAVMFSTYGRYEKLTYDLRARHTDSAFGLGATDSRSLDLSVSYPVTNRLTTTVGTSYRRDNLKNNQSKEMKERNEHYFRVGYNLWGNGSSHLLLEGYLKNEEDLRETSTVDEQEKGYKFEYRQQINDWNIAIRHENSVDYDHLFGLDTPKKRNELRLGYVPEGKSFQLGAFIEDERSGNNEERISYGISGSWDISNRTSLDGYWRKGLNDSGEMYNSDFYELKLRHQLNNGLEFGLRGSQSLSDASEEIGGRTKNTNWLAEINIPLDIPFRKRQNIGSASGEIIDAKSNRPISEVVIDMQGMLTVSDKSGKFNFPSIYAGDYDISVDLSHLDDKNYAIADGGTTMVTVVPDQNAKISIPLVEAAEFSGSVEYSDGKGRAGLLVTLTQLDLLKGYEAKVLKRLTLSGGQFSFYGVPPGRWQVHVVDPNNLLDHGKVDNAVRELVLSVGKKTVLMFKIVSDTEGLVKSGPSSGFTVESN